MASSRYGSEAKPMHHMEMEEEKTMYRPNKFMSPTENFIVTP